MATFAEMQQTNANIRSEYDIWRSLREEKGEDPVDWDAFRAHLVAIGHPDPGNIPPDDWVGDDYKAAHPDWWANYQSRRGGGDMSSATDNIGRAWRPQ